MKKPTRILTILLASITAIMVLIAASGFIKFNFLDVPYLGEQATYQTASGEEVIAHQKADGSIEISGLYFKIFHLKRTQSASGERYSDKNGSFIFWRKGDSMFIEQNKEITFRGTLKQPAYAE